MLQNVDARTFVSGAYSIANGVPECWIPQKLLYSALICVLRATARYVAAPSQVDPWPAVQA